MTATPHGGRSGRAGRSVAASRRPSGAVVLLAIFLSAIFVPILAAPGVVYGQVSEEGSASSVLEGTVRGRVEDGGRALAHALVEVVDGSRAVLADARGRYRIEGLPAGSVRIRATHLGFATSEVEVVLPESGVVSVDLELTRRAVELPGLLVRVRPPSVGEVGERRTVEEAARRTLVRLRSLDASSGITETGLLSALGGDGRNDPPDRGGSLLLRGSAADLKLVLLDGAPVYAPFHLGGLVQSFAQEVLGEARHYVGGAPARYDGGLSYVLDLRTRSPGGERLRASAGLDMMSARATVDVPLGSDAGLLVSSRGLHGAGGALLGTGGSPYGYGEGLVRLGIDAGGSWSMTAFRNRESVFLDLPTGTGLGGRDASWGNGLVSASWTGELGPTTVEVRAAGSRYDAELPVLVPSGEEGGAPPSTHLATGRTDRRRVTVDLARAAEAGPLRAGLSLDRVDARYGRLAGDPGPDGDPGPGGRTASGTVMGGYVEGSVRLGEEAVLRGGGRVDRFSTRDADGATDVAYRGALRASLAWTLGPETVLTLAAGRYHQLTRRSDADVSLAAGEGIQVGTDGIPASTLVAGPLLSLARADHLVASLDQRLGDRVGMTTEFFLKSFANVTGVGGGELNSSGVDLRIARTGERGEAWLGYQLSWFWRPAEGSDGATTEFTGRHLLTAGIEARLAGPVGFDAKVSFSDGLPLTAVPFGRVEVGEGSEPGIDPDTLPGTLVSDGGLVDGFLRLDGELFAEWPTDFGGRKGVVRPYLRVLNALDRRDALFFYFEPWRDSGPRPLAGLEVLPVLGVEWRF